MNLTIGSLLPVILLCSAAGAAPQDATHWRFHFNDAEATESSIGVTPETPYTPQRGYGCEDGMFSLRVPEGNYRVTATLGDPGGASDTTIKAESRRLMLQSVKTDKTTVQCSFIVNVRRRTVGDGEVKLKRDRDSLDWDERLTLEFNGPRPSVRALAIQPAPDAITVYIAGDSTVTDQMAEPWAGWGQMLPRFFKPPIAVANHAESGESLKSFMGEKRLEKLLSQIKAGDYLLIQFGHNDMKEKGEGIGAFTSFSDSLKHYVTEARQRNVNVILLTPMNRRNFDDSGDVINTHGDYPEAVRRVARELDVPLIDLHAMSKTLYEAWGPKESTKAFVHYPAGMFAGQDQPLKDNTHFNNYGAYEIARCVVEGIRRRAPALARFIADDVSTFDPAHPDPAGSIEIPRTPSHGPATAPAGK